MGSKRGVRAKLMMMLNVGPNLVEIQMRREMIRRGRVPGLPIWRPALPLSYVVVVLVLVVVPKLISLKQLLL